MPLRLRVPAALIAAALAATGLPGSEVDPACPPNLRAWRATGSAEPGGEWAARFLEIRGDVGILRELVLRFGDGALRPDEARWFDAPDVLEPIGFLTRTVSFVDRELRSVCRHLSDSQIAELQERARPRCYVDESGNRMLVKSQLTLTDSGLESSWQFSSGGIGLAVSAEMDLDEENLPCEPLETLETSFEGSDTSELGPSALESIAAVLDELDERDAPLESGLAALPPARHVLSVFRKYDDERVPKNLPSEFYLTAVAASDLYAEALSLERMLTAEDTDEEVALKLLGDRATSAAAPLLRLKLHASIAAKRSRIIALTLRALLAADARVARLEALPLLADPSLARPALGVYALTDAEVGEDLDSVDLSDADAVRDAVQRLLAHLEATAEDAIRGAIPELQRESID